MTLGRRKFLGVVTGAAGAAAMFGRLRRGPGEGPEGVGFASGALFDCGLVDFEERCALRESLAGYKSALEQTGVRVVKSAPRALPRCRTVILPGCREMLPETAGELLRMLGEGSCVVIESGAGFADPDEFREHKHWLQAHFGLWVEEPVDLWRRDAREGSPARPRQAALPRIPYVDYAWPVRVKVRDFSRVVPVSSQPGEVIGRVDGQPVASKRALGKGTLVFLGSPLGPALLSGDREARSWLRALVRAA